jgi:putative DNA primase/helicase
MMKSIAASAKICIRTVSRVITPPPRTIPTSCVNINALLMHLCDFDQFAYRYLLKWLAYPLQNPGAKMQHALVVNGAEGTGKSLFFEEVIAAIYGLRGHRLTAAKAFSTFNGWALNARYLVVNERVPARYTAEAKALVSNSSLEINQKGLPAQTVANELNLVFLSSSDDLMPLSASNRRFYVLEVPPPRDPLFYAAVADEIRNGGLSAFYEYLLQGVSLDGFNQFSEPPSIRVNAQAEFA